MNIRLDLAWRVDLDRWIEETGLAADDPLREVSHYLSDQPSCITILSTDGCPGYLTSENGDGWRLSEDWSLAGRIGKLRTVWHFDCPAEEWIAWREEYSCSITEDPVPRGRAREDATAVLIWELFNATLLSACEAAVRVRHPFDLELPHRWRLDPSLARKAWPRRIRW
ncbi:hypothetical protein ACFC1T_08835 [Kitasatospora sp. NPDC056076]|uniref:hypothetical protein n=1 Tax=Kitasatospora sp. NPDC056076 TaxID=3345703 RepID=UPI0035D56403